MLINMRRNKLLNNKKTKEQSAESQVGKQRTGVTSEQKFLLQVLSDHLSRRHTVPVSNLNWDVLFRLSRAHQVEGIFFYQCRDFMPDRRKFEEFFYATLFYNKNRRIKMSQLETELSQRCIPFFTVKGFETAQYYPVPDLRTMGDNDIIVHEEDKDEVGKVLLSLGFSYDLEFVGKEQIYLYQDMEYDLHHRLIYNESITMPEQEKFFNDCWTYVKNGKLDHSFHFLFLLVHLRKHLMNEGAGFRQFMDIAVVGNMDSELNWVWIEKKLEELRLKMFAEKCFSLLEFWFGICLPIAQPYLDKDFCEQATKMICDNGVFGFDDKDNKFNGTVNKLRRIRGPRWLGRMVMIAERLFPGYTFLCSGSSYSFLKGRPFLLPAAWMYRFYLMLCGRTTGGEEALRQILIPADVINRREEAMREWGLID